MRSASPHATGWRSALTALALRYPRQPALQSQKERDIGRIGDWAFTVNGRCCCPGLGVMGGCGAWVAFCKRGLFCKRGAAAAGCCRWLLRVAKGCCVSPTAAVCRHALLCTPCTG